MTIPSTSHSGFSEDTISQDSGMAAISEDESLAQYLRQRTAESEDDRSCCGLDES